MGSTNRISVAMIVAMAENRVIGRENELPWYLPEDLKYFKSVTMGKPIIMGRKTFESIGRPLPGRENIVVTRKSDYKADGVRVVSSASDAIKLAKLLACDSEAKEIMGIGGAQLYAEMLPTIDKLYLTQVHACVEGDAFFPEFDLSGWNELECKKHAAHDENSYAYSFVVYGRS